MPFIWLYFAIYLVRIDIQILNEVICP